MTTFDIKIRSIGMRIVHSSLLISCAIALAGCATHSVGRHAPIEERGIEMSLPARPVVRAPAPVAVANPAPTKKIIVTQNYVVQKGDTMYSLAFFNGIDYRELAELNKIVNPSDIHVGQSLRIPVASANKVVESKSIQPPTVTPLGGLKTQPKVAKIPYSETALAQAEAMQGETLKSSPVAPPVKVEISVVKEAEEEEHLEWGMPSVGKVITGFSETENRKGLDIAGVRGQAVVASAAGKVVYSGSGLRGYGKLVIIKHNKSFLSAYAHNDRILVKEGQSVNKGQQIAEMGDSDAEQIKLHFEIRKLGQPVDPAQYLPLIKP
jgi:lipoprotein NlpD